MKGTFIDPTWMKVPFIKIKTANLFGECRTGWLWLRAC